MLNDVVISVSDSNSHLECDALIVGLELELDAIFELLLVHVDDKVAEVFFISHDVHWHVSLFNLPIIPAHLLFSGIPGGVPSFTWHLDVNSGVNEALTVGVEFIKSFDLGFDQGGDVVLLMSFFLKPVCARLSEGRLWIDREIGFPITKKTW
jgi:hypothetical protein